MFCDQLKSPPSEKFPLFFFFSLTLAGLPCCKLAETTSGAPLSASDSSPTAAGRDGIFVSLNGNITISLSGSDPKGATLTYVINPGGDPGRTAHGSLSGTAPSITYTPDTGYSGSDSFIFKVNNGRIDSANAVVTITVNPFTIYLRSPGDSTGVLPGTSPLVHTAQDAVNAAIAAAPNSLAPVVIDVGALPSGNFGNVSLSQNFGQFVSWRGVDSTSAIGDITANGTSSDGYDDGNGDPDGGRGGAGFGIALNALTPLRFGNISSSGGSPGNPANGGATFGGDGGHVLIGPRVRAAGNIVAKGSGANFPGNGGAVELHGSANNIDVSAPAGDFSAALPGTVTIYSDGVAENVSTSSNVSPGGAPGGEVIVNGQARNIDASAHNALGGHVNVSGTASSVTSTGCGGGTVDLTGQVTSSIIVDGFDCFGSNGASGGVVNLYAGSHSQSVSAQGDGANFGGSGGEINVYSGAVYDLSQMRVDGGIGNSTTGSVGHINSH